MGIKVRPYKDYITMYCCSRIEYQTSSHLNDSHRNLTSKPTTKTTMAGKKRSPPEELVPVMIHVPKQHLAAFQALKSALSSNIHAGRRACADEMEGF